LYRKLPSDKERTPNTKQTKRSQFKLQKQNKPRPRFLALTPPAFVGGREIKLTNGTLATSVSTAGVNYDVCQFITVGTNFDSQRIGGVIEPIALAFDGCLMGGQSNVAGDDKYNQFRMVVVESTMAAIATFNPSIVSSVSPRSFPGIKKVLYDQNFDMASPGPDSVGYMPPVRHIKWSIPLTGKMMFSSPAAGTQTEYTILVSLVSDSAAAPSPGFVSSKITMFYRDN